MLPLSLRQERWVLQSASANQPNPSTNSHIQPDAQEAYELLNIGLKPKQALRRAPNNLVLARAINDENPAELEQLEPRWGLLPSRKRIAFLLPGELRCLKKSKSLLHSLQKRGDLFICTTKKFEAAAKGLQPTGLAIIEQQPDLQEEEEILQVPSMRQWFKLATCCKLMRQREVIRGAQYSYLVKLRSDYFYLHPQSLAEELAGLSKQMNSGLIGSSDKVFAGPRHLMLLFEGFAKALQGHFLDREANSWPLNLEPILSGDESAKWYGLGFPERLVGCPKTVDELRTTLIRGGPMLSRELSQRWQTKEPLINFFQGHPRFPSEVAFARFLNFNGIPLRNTPSMRGFLYSDRSQ